MRKNYWIYAIAAAAVVVVALTAWLGGWWWSQQQWFELQRQQLSTIKRLGEFPPAGWSPNTWKSALVTPYNVWGNVTYHPSYSKISNQEMRLLQFQLEQIVAQTTSDNSVESVDRVFDLLLQRGEKTEFISAYRDELRDSDVRMRESRRRHMAGEPAPAP